MNFWIIVLYRHDPLCKNQTFWKDIPCTDINHNEDDLERCSGYKPGQCFLKKNICNFEMNEWTCEDKSHLICNASRQECNKNDMWKCHDGSQCIHNSLVCDGNIHCNDFSDEEVGLCKICPKTLGFVKSGIPEEATYSCKHRHTGRWICSIPCNNQDDLCLDEIDEQCLKPNLIIIHACTVLGLLIGSLILGKLLSLQSNVGNTEHDEIYELVAECLDILLANNQNDQSQKQDQLEQVFKTLFSLDGEVLKLDVLLAVFQNGKKDDAEIKANVKLVKNVLQNMHTNDVEVLRCLQKNLGSMADFYFSITEPGCFTKLIERCKDGLNPIYQPIQVKINKFTSCCKNILPCSNQDGPCKLSLSLVMMILKATAKIAVHYVDLLKDLIFVGFLLTSDFIKWEIYNFGFIFILLFLSSIVVTEVVNLVIFLNHDFKASNKRSLSILFKCLFTVLMPGFSIFMTEWHSYKLEMECEHYSTLQNNDQDNTKKKSCLFSIQFHSKMAKEWTGLYATVKKSENVTENFPQFCLLAIFPILKQSDSRSIEGLQELLNDTNSTLVIISAVWSLLTLARVPLLYESHIWQGFQSFPGKILLALYMGLGAVARAFGILTFFTPSLGLLNTLQHWKMGNLPAVQSSGVIAVVKQINGTYQPVPFQDFWKQIYQLKDVIILNHHECFLIFSCLAFLNLCLIYLLKTRFCRKWFNSMSITEKLLEVLANSISPWNSCIWQCQTQKCELKSKLILPCLNAKQ